MADVTIEYSDDQAGRVAGGITAALRVDLPFTSGLTAEPRSDSHDCLGTAEIVITIVVLSLGKSLVLTLLDDLEKYLLKEYDQTPLDLQLHLKKDVNSTGRRVGVKLPGTGDVAVRTLVSSVRDLLSKL